MGVRCKSRIIDAFKVCLCLGLETTVKRTPVSDIFVCGLLLHSARLIFSILADLHPIERKSYLGSMVVRLVLI